MSAILIVSAAGDVTAALRGPFREAGHESAAVASVDEALLTLEERAPDLLLVDLDRAGAPAVDDCRRVKAHPKARRLPVIAVVPCSGEEERIAAFDLGVDDLVTKPFSVREVVLRVRAVLRRAGAGAIAHEPAAIPRAGRIALDLAAHRAFVDGAEVALTLLEFRLLAHLTANAGRVLSRKELLAHVWNVGSEVETRTVDTHVKRLRAKLGAARDALESIRRVGYRLSAPALEQRAGEAAQREPA